MVLTFTFTGLNFGRKCKDHLCFKISFEWFLYLSPSWQVVELYVKRRALSGMPRRKAGLQQVADLLLLVPYWSTGLDWREVRRDHSCCELLSVGTPCCRSVCLSISNLKLLDNLVANSNVVVNSV